MTSEMREFWNDVKACGQEARQANRDNAPKLLAEYGIAFVSKNCGAHLIVKHRAHTVNFWPGTGKWNFCNEPKRGRGIFPLIRELEGSKP